MASVRSRHVALAVSEKTPALGSFFHGVKSPVVSTSPDIIRGLDLWQVECFSQFSGYSPTSTLVHARVLGRYRCRYAGLANRASLGAFSPATLVHSHPSVNLFLAVWEDDSTSLRLVWDTS